MADARNADREFDLVLFGATGFTGRLTAEYLARHAPAGLRWALAGRNPTKLEGVRDRLADLDPDAGASSPLLHADVTDPTSLADVAGRARVVITTVGPYLTYGEPLVAACAEAGTDYVDLTGEPEFVDRMYLAHHATAERTGARIVHACGFDSIPHDLGALFTVQQLEATGPVTVRGVVRASGMFSGGTFHSAMTAMSRARQMKEASAARRRAEPRPEGRSSRAVAGKPHRDPVLGLLAAAAADDRPVRGGPQRRRAGVVRPEVPLLPLRRHQDAAVRRGRRGRRRRARPWPPRSSRCATCCSAGSSRATGPTSASGRSRGSPSTSSARATAAPCTPGSPAATPATTRPPRCSPSPRCAWPSTTTRPTAGQVTTAQAMGDNLLARLQAQGSASRSSS